MKARDIITKRLNQLGWKKSDLAYVAGTSLSSLSRSLGSGNGGVMTATTERIVSICAALDIDPNPVLMAMVDEQLKLTPKPHPDIEIRRKAVEQYVSLKSIIKS